MSTCTHAAVSISYYQSNNKTPLKQCHGKHTLKKYINILDKLEKKFHDYTVLIFFASSFHFGSKDSHVTLIETITIFLFPLFSLHCKDFIVEQFKI